MEDNKNAILKPSITLNLNDYTKLNSETKESQNNDLELLSRIRTINIIIISIFIF